VTWEKRAVGEAEENGQHEPELNGIRSDHHGDRARWNRCES
jgi:hypothetical protein